jgi:ATP-dependent RNA helicase DDX46/PRP5
MSPANSTKANGNIGSFGLKAKSAAKEDMTSKKALLDDNVDTGKRKRKLQTLPVFATQDECEPPAEAKDETAMQRREDRLCAHCHEKRHAARQSTS